MFVDMYASSGIQNLMCVGVLPRRRYVRDAKDEELYSFFSTTSSDYFSC